jgi:uncharacterized membrane protein
MNRIKSIDITRGIVMIIMALDHVRDFMHVNSVAQNPTNLQTTSPALFLTRWITHICAPTFVLLAGVSAYLFYKKTGDIATTRKFFFTRGLWLLFIEFTVVNFFLWFDIHFRTFMFEVIGAIGLGFIILALILSIPSKSIGIAGILIIFLSGLIPLIPTNKIPLLNQILSPLFSPGAIPMTPDRVFIIGYPPVPWMGIIFIGFATGKIFEWDADKRNPFLFKIGILALFFFVILRLINIYGDPAPWAVQNSSMYSFLSFMNISKYPPSLLFTLATLSISFLLLSITGNMENKFTRIAAVYGSVPLFYFIIHLFLIHGIMILLMLGQGFRINDLVFNNLQLGRPTGKSGVSLSVIYFIWVMVVIVLYPVCKWYSQYKSLHRENRLLGYL